MFQLSASLINQPVMSLRTGAPVASDTKPIINPNNLKIEGFFCQDRFSKETLVLVTQDIRDKIPQGFVINDHEVLSPPDDLIRLKKVIDIEFELIGKPVVTEKNQKVGKVNDYAADLASMYIKKIYVGQSMIKSISNGQLSVERDQIVEITSKKIIIKEPLKPKRIRAERTIQATA